MELFENTGDQNKAKMMLENIDNMKILNKRADNSKMKTKNSKYHNAKKQEKKKKDGSMEFADGDTRKDGSISASGDGSVALSDGIDAKDGSMQYTGGDGIKDISKELYGPATDISAILESLKNTTAKVFVGGGDAVSATNKLGYGNSFYYKSTGGGATLEYIIDKSLAALEE